jgi:hypothetical protein
MLADSTSIYNTQNLNETRQILYQKKGQTNWVSLAGMGMFFLEVVLYHHATNFTDQTMPIVD